MNTEKKLNKIIIISSPSGAGKTTICKELLKTSKDIILSISYTTRQKRINEKHGKDYYFVNNKEFNNLKKASLYADEIGLNVHAGHGITYESLNKLCKISKITEYNIGHYLISDSIFIGLPKVIRKVKKIMKL